MHFLLIYDLAPDYLERRGEFRNEHLKLAWEAQHKAALEAHTKAVEAQKKLLEVQKKAGDAHKKWQDLQKNPPKGGFAEAERIIHHILWQYQMPDQTALDGRRGLL